MRKISNAMKNILKVTQLHYFRQEIKKGNQFHYGKQHKMAVDYENL